MNADQQRNSPGDIAWPEPAPAPPEGYLDAVAGQSMVPAAERAFAAALTRGWSDPARLHHAGRRAGLILDTSRTAISGFLAGGAAEVFLGSSAADLLRAAIGGLYAARTSAGAPPRIIVGAAESMAVRFAAQTCPGAEVVDVPVDHLGRIELEALEDALSGGAAITCVQLANAEVGTSQPAAEIHARCVANGVPLVADAAQVIGHAEVGTQWDALVGAARDWAGPPGVGVLAVQPGVRWRPPEAPDRGWVGGFPDVPAAAAAAAAAEYLQPWWSAQALRHREQTARIREAITSIPGLEPVGDPTDRLPHILTFIAEDAVGERIVTELDRRGFAAASGSACTADTRMASHVLEAMGIHTQASVRLGLPFGCTDTTIDRFLDQLPGAVDQARL